jgi:RHS repeat-associated protein
MERILCDTAPNGEITAWYVHGPDLCYKVDATNGLTCYHADAQANIIALTDGSANLVAQYAYTPYGCSLGSTNSQSQSVNPYLFVGSQGVMRESDIPNLYFMRARYYFADAGVFLSTDPVKHLGPSVRLMSYVYCNNNPTMRIDPEGTSAVLDVLNPVLDAYDIGNAVYKERHGQMSTWAMIGNIGISTLGLGADVALIAVGAPAEGTAAAGFLTVAGAVGLVTGAASLVLDAIHGQGIPGALLQGTVSSVASSSLRPEDGTAQFTALAPAQNSQGNMGLPMAQMSGTNHSVSSSTVSAGATANNVSAATTTRPSAPSTGGTTASNVSTASTTKPSAPSTGGTTAVSSITIPLGSTLSSIAAQNNTTVGNLLSLNPQITNPNLIYAGRTLRIH